MNYSLITHITHHFTPIGLLWGCECRHCLMWKGSDRQLECPNCGEHGTPHDFTCEWQDGGFLCDYCAIASSRWFNCERSVHQH